MNLRSFSVFFFAAGILLALTGCSTFQSRAKQKAAVFNTLDVATQARLESGEIRVGDTMDAVYIALGSPDEKRDQTTAKERNTVWIYNHYWQEYRGDYFQGSRPVAIKNPSTGATTIYYEPVYRPVYENRTQERLRVTFKDGQVSVIEQAKN